MLSSPSSKYDPAYRSQMVVNLIQMAAESMTDMDVFSFVGAIKRVFNKEQETRASKIKQAIKTELRML